MICAVAVLDDQSSESVAGEINKGRHGMSLPERDVPAILVAAPSGALTGGTILTLV
jgi:hypothetical protein